MDDLIDEFNYRKSLLEERNYSIASTRIKGFLEWLNKTPETKKIIDDFYQEPNENQVKEMVESASNPEEIAVCGIFLMKLAADGKYLHDLAYEYDISPTFKGATDQDHADEIVERFIEPAINYIERKLEKNEEEDDDILDDFFSEKQIHYPLEIHESLIRFHKDHPDINRNAFIMMRFGDTDAHKKIMISIKSILSKYKIKALRADEKEYHEDLFPNVLTYIYGSNFGIAVFERLETEDFNPNVSLEVGYMRALKKPICLLKDKTLEALQTDLVGKLYRAFDPQSPEKTIPKELEKWLRDKEIIT